MGRKRSGKDIADFGGPGIALHLLRKRRRRRAIGWLVLFLLALSAAGIVYLEIETSYAQSRILHRVAKGLTFTLVPGPSDSIWFPVHGPFDERRGFTRIPLISRELLEGNFEIRRQARHSRALAEWIGRGIPAIYPEGMQAGLVLLDRRDEPMYESGYPQRVYDRYEEIPDVVVRVLLFIEDRDLMDPQHRRRNPAVEWDRLGKAVLDFGIGLVRPDHPQPGGSTLATQIEKFRHSPEGLTASVPEKLRQMTAASLRAYQAGSDTRAARKEIVRTYVNSVPLAGVPGYGEVNGLGDGLWAWFGLEFEETNRLLHSLSRPEGPIDPKAAAAFKQLVSLFIAHRRPSVYLILGRGRLEEDTSRYLRMLASEGIITEELRDTAVGIPLSFRTTPAVSPRPSFIDRKAANAVRSQMVRLLRVEDFYALDRFDLTAGTTMDGSIQRRLSHRLERLRRRETADSLGLVGHRLLERGDPAGVIYSFTLYEATPEGNLLRVQVDNYDQPLDINEGAKLELGSTAKLRTLATYLEIVAALHRRHAGRPREQLRAEADLPVDPIRKWTLAMLASSSDTTLAALLEAAMNRSYSASPHEQFFTGSGVHTFSNFDDKDDGRVMSVREGFRRSVNLVFIRVMRDIVRHYRQELPDYPAVLNDPRHPNREEYLKRFADQEGRSFLEKFQGEQRRHSPAASLDRVAMRSEGKPKRLAALFRYVYPDADRDSLELFLARYGVTTGAGTRERANLYTAYGPDAFDLHDRAYILDMHPLELWLVRYRIKHPNAGWSEIVREGADARMEAYKWLFRTRSPEKQNKRIAIMLEAEAFRRVHEAWKRLGYPFETLVPSYATSIGSSADRPAALAELVGIVANDGIRRPSRRLSYLHFAEGTPYETLLEYRPTAGRRVMPAEVARVVKEALRDVVERGTAGRCARAFPIDGGYLPVGGKTGTGDQRHETIGRGGQVIDSRVMNRTATFVFLIGERFFGTITAYVPGSKAADYAFTSALPVQLLTGLAPDLAALIMEAPASGGTGSASH